MEGCITKKMTSPKGKFGTYYLIVLYIVCFINISTGSVSNLFNELIPTKRLYTNENINSSWR